MKKILTGAVLAFALLIPVFSFALMTTIAPEGDYNPNETQTDCVALQNNLGYRMRDARTNNDEVSLLQDFLIGRGTLNLNSTFVEATGYFGGATLAAVKKLQQSIGLQPTGYVGPLTRGKIKAMTCDGVTPVKESTVPGCTAGALFSATTGRSCAGSTTTTSAPTATLTVNNGSSAVVGVGDRVSIVWSSANADSHIGRMSSFGCTSSSNNKTLDDDVLEAHGTELESIDLSMAGCTMSLVFVAKNTATEQRATATATVYVRPASATPTVPGCLPGALFSATTGRSCLSRVSAAINQDSLNVILSGPITIKGTAYNTASVKISVTSLNTPLYPTGYSSSNIVSVQDNMWSVTYSEGLPSTGTYTVKVSSTDLQTGRILTQGILTAKTTTSTVSGCTEGALFSATTGRSCVGDTTTPTITMISPQAGAIFAPGDRINVNWSSTNLPGMVVNVTLEGGDPGHLVQTHLATFVPISNGSASVSLPANARGSYRMTVWVTRIADGDPRSVLSANIISIQPVVTTITPVVKTTGMNYTSDAGLLAGYIDSKGATVKASGWFEWGTTTSLGNSTPCEYNYEGVTMLSCSANISGLTQNTAYYFRIAASGPQGNVYGNTLSFRTSIATITIASPNSGAITKIGDAIPVSWSYVNAPLKSQVVVSLKLIQQASYSTVSGVSGGTWQSPLLSSSFGVGSVGNGSHAWTTGPGRLELPGLYEITANISDCDPRGCNYNSESVRKIWATSNPVRFTIDAPPTLTFTASPSTISLGGNTVLAWFSTGATSCNAPDSNALSGSVVAAPYQTNTYNVVCTGPGGSVTKSVTVTVSAASITVTSVVPVSQGQLVNMQFSSLPVGWNIRIIGVSGVSQTLPVTSTSLLPVQGSYTGNSVVGYTLPTGGPNFAAIIVPLATPAGSYVIEVSDPSAGWVTKLRTFPFYIR